MARLCAYMSRRSIEKLIYEKKLAGWLVGWLDHRRTFPFRGNRFMVLDPPEFASYLRELVSRDPRRSLLLRISRYTLFIRRRLFIVVSFESIFPRLPFPFEEYIYTRFYIFGKTNIGQRR